MIILQDTRESRPLIFNDPYITEVKVTKLEVGDYGCEYRDNHIPPIYFERKSIGDLFSSLTGDYKRFKKELQRSQDNRLTLLIIIEGTLTKVLKGYRYSTFAGISVVRKLFTIWVRYGIKHIYCRDREEMAEYITQFYYSVGKERLKKLGKRRL